MFSAKTPPPRSKVSCAVDEGYDNDFFGGHAIDETVISNEQLAVLVTPKLWNPTATIGQDRERLR